MMQIFFKKNKTGTAGAAAEKKLRGRSQTKSNAQVSRGSGAT
jgi:hypothetical protein